MSDEIKKQQVVQFLRNNIQNNNIQPNRQSAIELIDKISNNLDTLGAKDGEPVIVRYLDDNNEIITYMAVVAERNGKLVLSHVTNDIDMNTIIQITESSITSSVSALSGDLSSMIEQTASSITSTVDDKINDTMSVVKQTASSITQSVIDSTNFSTQEQTSELIKQEIGNVLKSVKTYYKLSSSKPSEVNKKDDPIKFGWSETYILKSSKEDSLYSFTRYTYGDGSVIQTEISETAAPEDGATYYTWIRYSESGATSTRTFNDPVYNGKVLPYIGFSYNNTDENESDEVSAYTWSLIKGEDGVPGEPGKNGKTLYTWIAYADELIQGKDYPETAYQQPNEDTKYIGICPNQETATEGSDWEKYTWSRFRGSDGIATTYYTWIRYSESGATSTRTFNDPVFEGKVLPYIGFSYNNIDKNESDEVSAYTWSLIKGEDGVPGEPGKNGKTLYTWIAYADELIEGKDYPSSAYQQPTEDTKYIGICPNQETPTEGTDWEKYTWSRFRGADGVGSTLYTWIRYSESGATSTRTFNDPVYNGKVLPYIGFAYNKESKAESENVSDYTWSLIKGEKGVSGDSFYTWIAYADELIDGKDYPAIAYQQPNKDTKYIGICPNQEIEEEDYDWKKYTWSKFRGDDGVSIKSYTWIRYSESGATSTRVFNDPVFEGKVLPYIGFAYNKESEIESENVSDYTWSLIKGEDGAPGEPGKNGKTLYTWIAYADELNETDSSGKKYPSSAYQQPTDKTVYIGIRPNQETPTEGTDWEKYTWSRFRGTDGVSTTYYTWVRYSESGATSTRTFNDPVYNGEVLPYIGFAYNKETEKESDEVSAYTWSLIKGKDGVPGEPGKNGKTLYTWIAYADVLNKTDASGKKYPSSAYQQPTEDTKYIGICPNQETATEGSNWENYSWSRFRGADGVGTTYYTWVKYANELDSEGYGVNISDANKNDDGTYKKYIGTGYNKTKAESDPTSTSTDPKEYTWSPYAPNDSNKYVIVPKDANGLKAIIKADDNIHVNINCYAAKVDAEGVPVTVTDGSIVMYYCDNINANFREIKVNSNNLFTYTNEKYQEGVHNLADNEEVKSIMVSIFLKNKGTISQDFALDTKTINPSYTSNFLRTETSSAVTQSLINEFGDLSTFKQTASGWTSIVQNLSGDVSTVKQTASSLSSTVQNLSGDVSTVKQTSSALSSTVQNLSGNMSSMEQTVSGINVTVGNIGQNQEVMSAKFTELGEKITNGGLTADTVNTNPYNDNGPRIVMEGGEIGIYRAASAATPNIQFGYKNTDVSGNPLNMMVLSFYDNDGNLLYDLGPGGIMWVPGGENQEEHFTDDEHKIMRKLFQGGSFDSRSNLLMLAYAEYKHLISLSSLPTGTNLGEYEYAKKYYAKKVKGEYVDGEYSFVDSDPYANLMDGKYVCKVDIENDKDSSFANAESYYETREYINNTSNIFVIANKISDLENSVFENSLGGGTKGDYYIPLLKSEDNVKGKYTTDSPYYELWKIFNKGDYSVDNGDWFYRKDFFVMNTSPTTFYLDISKKNGVTNVGTKYTFTSEKCPIEYKNNTENILNIASDSIGYLYDPIICFTYKDILYDNNTEIVETYYEFHNLSRVYQKFVDGNYNERIDDNNTLYSDKQATFTGDIIYYA